MSVRKSHRSSAAGWIEPVTVFAEALLMGFVVVASAIPAVTFVAALTAGNRHIVRTLRGSENGFAPWWADFRIALRKTWALSGAVIAGIVLVVAVDQPLLRASVVPGGPVIAMAVAAAAVISVSLFVRASGHWEVGDRWGELLESAATSMLSRWGLITTLAIALAALMWKVLPLAIAMFGIAMLSVALERIRQGSAASTASAMEDTR